jgi:hypothetical protein
MGLDDMIDEIRGINVEEVGVREFLEQLLVVITCYFISDVVSMFLSCPLRLIFVSFFWVR